MTDSEGRALFVTLREYFELHLDTARESLELKILALEAHVEAQFKSENIARTLAVENQNERLSKLNELRGVVTDQAMRFATKDEMFTRLDGIGKELTTVNTEIRGLRESRALLEGKASQNAVMVAWVISAAALLFSAIGLVMRLMGK